MLPPQRGPNVQAIAEAGRCDKQRESRGVHFVRSVGGRSERASQARSAIHERMRRSAPAVKARAKPMMMNEYSTVVQKKVIRRTHGPKVILGTNHFFLGGKFCHPAPGVT